MPSHSPSLIAAAVAAALLLSAQGAALAQATPPTQSPAVIATLQQQGRYWQGRQPERAAEAWKKLLAVEPGNAEALSRLGSLALDAKKPDEARRYLEQLRKAHPDSQELKDLEQDIELASPAAKADLDQARILVREKRVEESAQKYKSLFKGRQPLGRIGVEYYSVLGYTSGGREEALAGLQRLARTYPNDGRIELTIASLRLQNQATRMDAMRSLAALSKRGDVGGEATEQWRGAMGWLGSPPPAAYVPLFRQYLAANPDDTEIREQLAGRGPKLPGQGVAQQGRGGPGGNAGGLGGQRKLDPVSLRMADGFAALNSNKIDEAEAAFAEAHRLRPGAGGPLGGLGLVRIKQQRWSEARDYLRQAERIDGPQQWKQASDSAAYWELVQQAGVSRTAGRYDEATRRLQQAMAIDPDSDDTTAENTLAGVYTDQKRTAEAERTFRHILARFPDDPDALRGLVGTLSSTGRTAEALALIEGLTPEQRSRIDIDKLRAEQAFGEGRAALARGEDGTAREKLQQAVNLAPDNPWMRLELARLDLRNGARTGAANLMQSLLERQPKEPEVIYTNGLFLAETKDWPGVLELMDRIPPAQRTPAMGSLQRSAAVNVQADQALALAHDGRRADANALLAQTATRVGDDAELLAIVAQAYVDLGELDRARALLTGAIERSARNPANASATTALQLRYGDVLLAAEDDASLATLLRQLQARDQAGQLDSDDRSSVETLRRAYVARQAEALRKQGRLAPAYELIKPLLADTPQDPALLGLLARMYADAGQEEQAQRIYRDMLQREPDDVNTLLASAGLALSQRNLREADERISRAETLAPQNPDVLATRGRLYRVQGRPAQAVVYLKRAEAAVIARNPGLVPRAVPRGQNPPAGFVSTDNPFAGYTPSVRSADPSPAALPEPVSTRPAR
ncbi:tetratricopeptide repeat protein [Xylophilus rhododendri]|uniref:Tetratricopeptide repeat protein n=1 Tax=Xylophilus rhododendri TaxID=2697032 RepID=A0A857J4N4_9BURK|nr:tetratricopeptide repeat protein [Xylophilus rhododendri]QHI98924.1 tetratricopeptide repeat protein [Xylophilus rhododendri]